MTCNYSEPCNGSAEDEAAIRHLSRLRMSAFPRSDACGHQEGGSTDHGARPSLVSVFGFLGHIAGSSPKGASGVGIRPEIPSPAKGRVIAHPRLRREPTLPQTRLGGGEVNLFIRSNDWDQSRRCRQRARGYMKLSLGVPWLSLDLQPSAKVLFPSQSFRTISHSQPYLPWLQADISNQHGSTGSRAWPSHAGCRPCGQLPCRGRKAVRCDGTRRWTR